MNLPNYFLADLPADTTLGSSLVTEACHSLKRNRQKYLATRTTQSMIELLTGLAREWLEPENPFRKLALEQGPDATGFSSETLGRGLDELFKELTPENFTALLEQDFGNPACLDDFAAPRSHRAALAVAPELLVHVAAGNLPNPTLLSIVFGLLLRSAQFVKCATGSAFLPRLFGHSLYEADPKIGSCLEVAQWSSSEPRRNSGGAIRADSLDPVAKRNTDLLRSIFEQAACVTATGNDETLSAVRRLVPPKVRFVGHGHRVSFAYIAGGMLASATRRATIQRAANDVVAWNQLGCLSPHAIYVENSDGDARQFANLLAAELERREQSEPRGDVPVEVAATIASRRSFYEIRAAQCEDPQETRLWHSQDSTAWTVVYEQDPRFQVSCLHRFVYVKEAKDLAEALRNADAVHGQVSTVGLAAPAERVKALALELARWGVTRVCPLGKMQNPPLTWRHDGRPPLGELVTWTDLELE
jgi:hypothetical protein